MPRSTSSNGPQPDRIDLEQLAERPQGEARRTRRRRACGLVSVPSALVLPLTLRMLLNDSFHTLKRRLEECRQEELPLVVIDLSDIAAALSHAMGVIEESLGQASARFQLHLIYSLDGGQDCHASLQDLKPLIRAAVVGHQRAMKGPDDLPQCTEAEWQAAFGGHVNGPVAPQVEPELSDPLIPRSLTAEEILGQSLLDHQSVPVEDETASLLLERILTASENTAMPHVYRVSEGRLSAMRDASDEKKAQGPIRSGTSGSYK